MALTSTGEFLLITLGFTIGLQLSFFAIAFTCKFDKVTDIAGTMNFVILAWLMFWLQGTYYARQIVVLALVSAWGFRLGFFLLSRVLKRGKDARFDQMREKFFPFLGFWLYQIVWVWTVSLPVTVLMGAKNDTSLSGQDYVGWALWGIGFFFQVAADQSKMYFTDNPANKGKLLTTNVWSWSRHPNYFGEISMWLGIFLTSSAVYSANTKWAYFSITSPLLTYLLLMYLSGVKMAEDRYNQTFKNNQEWIDYRKRTSVLVPFPPCLFSRTPYCLKWLFFCEYKMFALESDAGTPSP